MLTAYRIKSATSVVPALEALSPTPDLEMLAVGSASSLDELTRSLPGGAYTTLRTFHGRQALHLESHFQRLEETGAMVGLHFHLNRQILRHSLRQALQSAQELQASQTADNVQENDYRLRLTLDLESQPGDLYLALQPLEAPPAAAYQSGVSAVTCQMQRLLPKAKLTRFIERSSPLRQALPAGVNEAIMFDQDGNLLEGLTSNFFCVIAGEIWTAEQGVLSGITRQLVLEAVQRLGIPLHLDPARLSDLARMQEAFITSSSRGVLPLKQIDERRLPAAPGSLTEVLMQDYVRSLEILLEEI